jgi:hypothetical protein
MTRMRSMAPPALLALVGLGLWGSSAAAQYVVGGTAYAPGYYYGPGYYYAPGPVSYGSGYDYAPRPAAGPYYAPAPAPSYRSSVLVPVGPSGRNYPGRPGPLYHYGLEPESLPAQIAEDTIPASATPRPGPTWGASRWRGRMWRRTWRNW